MAGDVVIKCYGVRRLYVAVKGDWCRQVDMWINDNEILCCPVNVICIGQLITGAVVREEIDNDRVCHYKREC